MKRVITALAATAVGMFGLGTAEPESYLAGTLQPPGASVRVAAVGDIACQPPYTVLPTECRHAAVARLIRRDTATAVLGLGDQQYETGDLIHFQESYDTSWGALKGRTYPVPGNHEYRTGGAAGYFSYFGQRAGGAPGYYSFNLGSWRIYALNSNCVEINCSTEADWLRADLASNPRACVAAYMHHPLWSSGNHGSDPSVEQLWEPLLDAKADLMLASHDHDYERFARMGLSGPSATGMRLFVSGLGGKTLYRFGTVESGSQVRYNSKFGALFLTLSDAGFSWEFKSIDGVVKDAGSDECLT